ncbi:hypothetical protein [Pseudoalteromonas obscura]|uniref:Uncharacterized protein n=1 Tax=Pseudoalteromonas obscura TaxID=3048491 RepID=A0ABT7EKQ4_9GAMM|nr:hypothetical protein [Pseudoalteromonas sp. P94(2023)]MDK2595632.1 hypothetical protein [Pseudoalteromonas sp. P94(2023)]
MSNWHISVLVVVASILAVMVILPVAIVTVMYPENELPEVLVNWGGIILGFFFGTLTTALTSKVERKSRDPSAEN